MNLIKNRLCFALVVFHFGLAYVPAFCQEATFWSELKEETKATQPSEIPKFTFEESELSIENQLEKVLDSLADQSRKAKLIQGYRILIYSGNSREEATKSKEMAYKSIPNVDVYTSYLAPTFKVKLGDFYQKLDAYLTLKKLQAAFPMAVIVNEVVHLKL
ncbi:MAG TPA: hypothetical protein PKY12_10675 [Catalimonadaceae bacterium]|nr:hypothetical protein [Catalimonadaceae bacterium]